MLVCVETACNGEHSAMKARNIESEGNSGETGPVLERPVLSVEDTQQATSNLQTFRMTVRMRTFTIDTAHLSGPHH